MGVTGLWRLLEPAGKPVPLETLEDKILAVDISIWLHQMVKGYQDPRGGTVVNAHLLGLFQRLCKLLYYRIKPVFVFDGGVPVLKIQTISKRQSKKSEMHNTVDRMRKQLLEIVTKQMAVSKVISEKSKSPKKRSPTKPSIVTPYNDDTLFKLPPIENKEATVDSSDSDSEDTKPTKHVHMDLHSLDVNSQYFKSLTPREKHDLLTELKETRKQSSWGRIHELPSQSDNFSNYQMQRLLKRRQVQVSLEETEKEMGGHYLSLNELEVLLNEEGIDTHIESIPTRQIASDENTHYILIKDVKEALENATKKELEKKMEENKKEKITDVIQNDETSTDLGKEYDEDLETALKLSLECFDAKNTPSSSKMSEQPQQDSIDLSFADESSFLSSDSDWETDSEHSEPEVDNTTSKNLALVKAYMLENSGLTEHEIKRIIHINSKKTSEIKTKTSSDNNLGIAISSSNVGSSVSESKASISSQNSKALSGSSIQGNAISTIKIESDSSSDTDDVREIGVCDNTSLINVYDSTQTQTVDLCSRVETVDSNNGNPSLETSDPCTSQSKDVIEMSSESESDDSFEEVVDEIEQKENVEVNLNFHVPPKDDIFADIFENEIQSKQSKSKEAIPTTDSETSVPRNEVSEHKVVHGSAKQDSAKIETNMLSTENNLKRFDAGCESATNSTVSVGEKIDLLRHNKNSLKDSNKLEIKNVGIPVPTVEEFTNSVTTEKLTEVSPKRSMKLNEVKHLASQEDSEIKTIDIPIEKQLISTEGPITVADDSNVDSHIPSVEEFTDSTQKPVEVSHTKGMTLNEVRHLASQESSEIKTKDNPIEKQLISTEELITIADDLEEQKEKLQREQSKLDRMGRNISEEMTKDVQHLLKLFGIPYIIAPMEAEAQCAFLEAIKLTDGTITDDSDIWLFGGKCVYKNFFNQQKYVLQFLSENIQSCFNLSREQLVLLALLVGSDYTTGVTGVGPVTAMEILSSFPPQQSQDHPPYSALLQGLKKFKSWCNDNRAYGHGKLRSKLKNISIHQDFPSYKVVEAYLVPQVDKSSEPFSWGKPDVTSLRDYTKQKFGWSQTKTDEILNPVLKRLDEKIIQKSIRSFFRTEIKNVAAKENMSKRVRKAVERMGNNGENSEDDQEFKSKAKKPRKSKAKKTEVVSKCTDETPPATDNNEQEKMVINSPLVTANVSAMPVNNTSGNVKESGTKDVKPFIPERYQETIPQRESDKTLMMKNKLKAIELFRTSKQGPGFIKKRGKRVRQPKPEAELSESDSN